MKKQQEVILNLLRELKFPHTARPNVAKAGYKGFVLGKVISWAGKGEKAGYQKLLSLRTQKHKYKDLYRETKKLMKIKDPKFQFSSIQYNKNHKAMKHTDGNNVGTSMIIGLGDYTGGELIVYDKDGKNPTKHNIKNRFIKFNGSIYPHETAPFKGERYSLVFYNI